MIVLIRGLPGSGKSTLARDTANMQIKIGSPAIHLEADMYFIDKDKNYKFDAELLPHAHHWCYETAKVFNNLGATVYVSNTFSRLWEMDEYLALDPSTLVFKAIGDFGNTHNVPESVIFLYQLRCRDQR